MEMAGQTYGCSTGILDIRHVLNLRIHHELEVSYWPLKAESKYTSRSTRTLSESRPKSTSKVLFKVIAPARSLGLNSQSIFGCLIDNYGVQYAYANIVLTRNRLTLHVQK